MRNKLEEKRGITLVSLVVTIIILIILAGISINMTIGNNGIITIAKKARENIEISQIEEEKKLNELYTQIGNEEGISGNLIYDSIAKLNEFKKKISDYIEQAGGIKPEYTAEAETFGEQIKGIVKEVTKDATATADNITAGKTAWVNGVEVIGTLTNKNDDINLNFTNVYVLNNKIFQCLDVRNYNILEIKLKTGARPTDGSKNSAPYTLGVYSLNEMFTGENATVEPNKNLIESYTIPTNTTEYLSYTLDISNMDYIGFTTTNITAYVNFKISIKQ